MYVSRLHCRFAICPCHVQKTSGDFPTVLFEVVSKRSSVIEGSLSVEELNDILDELAKSMGKQYILHFTGANSFSVTLRDAQSKILQRVYNRTTPEEQRWIVRIILKGLSPLGARDYTVKSSCRHGHIREGSDRVLRFSSGCPRPL